MFCVVLNDETIVQEGFENLRSAEAMIERIQDKPEYKRDEFVVMRTAQARAMGIR
jgi:hypothetical protein